MPLGYTIKKMLEGDRIFIERDAGEVDEFGGEPAPDWQPLATVDALFWWWPVHGAGKFDEDTSVQRTVNTTGGGAMVANGTDVTEEDRVSQVEEADGTIIPGPFRITSIRVHSSHTELSLERP